MNNFYIFINVKAFEPKIVNNMGRPCLSNDIRVCLNCQNQFEVKRHKKNKFCGVSCSQIYTKSLNKDWLLKRDTTNLEKYGVKSPLQSPQVRENYKNSIQSKYGVDNPFQVKKFRDKANNTIKQKYGVSHANQNKEVANKISLSLKGRVLDRNNFMDIKWEKLEEYYKITGMKPNFDKVELADNKLKDHKFKFQCDKCNSITEVSINNGYLPSCKCSNYKGYSVIEEEILKFLCEYIDEKEIDLNRRDILPNRLEIDCFIPSLNLAIEVNGIYWHSESMGKYKDYHLFKTLKCLEKGINLTHILDYEWVYKKPIVKSIILNKINKTPNRLYARKCKVIPIIDTTILREFLNTNHIQGYTHAKTNLGLYHEGELVSVMTFGKNRFKKNSGELEMVRFCNKLNTNIIGGASKLFKYFLNNNNPDMLPIISFADRRFFDGSLYLSLGFGFESFSSPSYIYWKNSVILNRMSCQKHKLKELLPIFDVNKTEYENMKDNGWRRVWDCGNTKYRFK